MAAIPRGLPSWPWPITAWGIATRPNAGWTSWRPTGPRRAADFSWDDVEIRILRREAESLILGGPPAAPSPAAPAPTKKAAGHPGAKPE